MRYMDTIETWGDMKTRLKEKYLPSKFRNRLLNKLHTLRQGSMSVQNYMTHLMT